MGFLKEFAKGFGQGYIEQRGIDGTLEDLGSLARGVKNFFSDDNNQNEEVSVFEGYNELYENGNYEDAAQYVKDFYREYSLSQDYVYNYLIAQAEATNGYVNDDLSKLDRASNLLGKAKNMLSPQEEDYKYLNELADTIRNYRNEIKKSKEGSANWEKVTTKINELIGEGEYDQALTLIDDHYNRYESTRDFWYYEWRAYVLLCRLENDGMTLSEDEIEVYTRRFNNEINKAKREDQDGQYQDTLNGLKERLDVVQQNIDSLNEWKEYSMKFENALSEENFDLAEKLINSFYSTHDKDYFYWNDLCNLYADKGMVYREDNLRKTLNEKENNYKEAQFALGKMKSISDGTDSESIDKCEIKCQCLKQVTVDIRSNLLAQDGLYDAAKTLLDEFFDEKDYYYYQYSSRNESYHVLNEVMKGTTDFENLKNIINNAENLLNLAISMTSDEDVKKSLKEITGGRIEKGKEYLKSQGNSTKGSQNISGDIAENTENENEYITELKACFEDGEISERERRLLDKLRRSLGISEKRALELEAQCNPNVLSKDEEEYAQELKAVLEDGIITEKERRLLNRLAKSLNISENRALEIENLISNKK